MLKFLGRGSAFNVKEGNTAAYIKENNSLFLIDCGSNIFERIIQNKILDGVSEVNVAITHRHPDHVGSLGDLIFYCYYIKNIKVNILSEDEFLEYFLLVNGVLPDIYNRQYEKYISVLDMQIKFIRCNHTSILGNFKCYSIILTKDEKSIFYSGDAKSVSWNSIGYCDFYYVDTCIADYPENVHYNINLLHKDCIVYDKDIISKIWCMHFDSDEAISKAKELGFNVVEVERYETCTD